MANLPAFQDLFDQAYRASAPGQSRTLTEAVKSIAPNALPGGMGHPDYEHLEIGETEPGTVVVSFVDIRGFTKLAIALDNREVVRILQATLAASILSVGLHGGHVADLTGDGVMALFGGRHSTDAHDARQALAAAAYLLDGARGALRKHLQSQGDETVRLSMGLDYGEVLWTRLGLPHASPVKPISGVSFLAGKLSTGKYTDAWECKIGAALADWLPDQYKRRGDPPNYEFTYEGKPHRYGLYEFLWERFHRDRQQSPFALDELLKGRRLPAPYGPKAAAAAFVAPTVSTGPRPLKDQPYFAQLD
jgi:class 3 adenylate cyclase